LKHFEQAILINPNYADVYTWMAQILDWSMGRYAEAFAVREKALQLDPLSIPALVNFVNALLARDRLAEAERELNKLASLAPNYSAMLRASTLVAKGDWADGALSMLALLRFNAENQNAESGLSYLFALMGLENEVLAREGDADPELMRLLGMPQQAVAAAQADLAEDPLDQWRQVGTGRALAGAGDYVEARPYLEASWQKFGTVFAGPRFNVDHATALIAARRDAGEGNYVADLVAAIRDNVRRYDEAGIVGSLEYGHPQYEKGLVHYLEGDEQRGLVLIAQAVEDGYFIPPNLAYLQTLYDHPGFVAIGEIQETRQAREREKLRSAVCAENPYAAVWQPAEGTCEEFSAKEGN
jgi:tetratricopeptide (TPR) repeat protein